MAPDWNSTLGLSTVFVLSLPAFHWQQKSIVKTDHARWDHSCNIINRQMIVVGGVSMNLQAIEENNGNWPWSVPDPWPQGLNVFDTTNMEWKDIYDPGAGPYRTPAIVKQYYASNPRYSSAILDDEELRDWFMKGQSFADCPLFD